MSHNSTTVFPRPLTNVNSVMGDLDLSAQKVRELIEEGKLIGFNIAVRETSRQSLRLLIRSIEHYRETDGKKSLVMTWPEIFKLILPHEKPYVRGIELQRALNCDDGHVENLISSGIFAVAKKSRRGPGGSSIVTRDSFEKFLKGRLQ